MAARRSPGVWVLLLAAALPRSAAPAPGAAAWLEEGLGARWRGLGGAARAAADDVHAARWNPAALSALGPVRGQLAAAYASSGRGRSTATLAGAWQTDRAGTFAAAWSRRTAAGLERVDAGGAVGETVTAAEDVLALAGGWALSYQFRAGAALKLHHAALFDATAWGISGDLGVRVQPLLDQSLFLAAVLESADGTIGWSTGASDRPARVWAAGAAWRWLRDHVLLSVDLAAREGRGAAFRGGVEIQVVAPAAVRFGWDGRRPAAGASYRWAPYGLDYAYVFDANGLGALHLVSFLIDL